MLMFLLYGSIWEMFLYQFLPIDVGFPFSSLDVPFSLCDVVVHLVDVVVDATVENNLVVEHFCCRSS